MSVIEVILITVETGMAEKMFEVKESSGVLGKIYLTEKADNVWCNNTLKKQRDKSATPSQQSVEMQEELGRRFFL